MTPAGASGAERAADLRRTRDRGRLVVAAILAALSAAWLVGFAAIAALFPEDGAILWAMAVVFPAVGLSVAYVMFRSARPPALRGELRVLSTELRRGDAVRVSIVMRPGATSPGAIEVGIVVVERYDVEQRGQDGSSRATRERTEAERWRPVGSSVGATEIELDLPDDAPYSYEGRAVSYRWRVEARQRRRLRMDRRAIAPIWVRP